MCANTCIFIAALSRVEDFYDSIGGLIGYQRQCLALIAAHEAEGPTHAASSNGCASGSWTDSAEWPSHGGGQRPPAPTTEFLVPAGLDLASPEQAAATAAAVAAGIDALPRMAEIYPLGGAGDRLGLRCDVSGESLPTAVLQYCGRSLLENLVRDLQVSLPQRACGGAGWGGWVRSSARCVPSWAAPHSALRAPLRLVSLASEAPAARQHSPPGKRVWTPAVRAGPSPRHASTCTGSCAGARSPLQWPS